MSDPSKFDGGPRCVLVVGSAYLVQGLVAAVGVLLLIQFAMLGVSLADQGRMLASGAVPWVLKFGIALLFDFGPRWSIRLRALALTVLQTGAAAGVWWIAQAFADGPPSSVFAVAVGWFALNLCIATQDVIVDALALDTLADRRPAAATAMGGGVVLGFNVLGLWLVAGRFGTHGFAAALAWPVVWIAALALVPAIALAGRTERPSGPRRSPDARATPRELGALIWIPLLFAALPFAGNLTSAVAGEFLVNHLGWEAADIATRLAPISSLAAIAGSLGCGFLVAKLGSVRAAILSSVGLGLVWLGFAVAAPLWSQPAAIMTFALGEGAFQPAMMVALHGLALVAAARTPMPTTAFVLAMASLNLSRVLAPLPFVTEHALLLGWTGLFAACGLAQILVSGGILPLSPYTPGRHS